MLVLWLIPRLVTSEEGYAHRGLPGSGDDTRPNLPFTVSVNRENDGISSTSPLTATSPSFPSDRTIPSKRHWTDEKRLSEIEQGVGGRWDGSFVAEERAVHAENTSAVIFSVNATLRWNPSGFAIQRGETYLLQVAKEYWVDGFLRVTADGYDSEYDAVSECYVAGGQCRSYLTLSRRHTSTRWFHLVCGIGEFQWPLLHDYFMPLREEELTETFFSVGSGPRTFLANYTGELLCFANDADSLYWNNRGAITVTVSRVSDVSPRTNFRSLLTDPMSPPLYLS